MNSKQASAEVAALGNPNPYDLSKTMPVQDNFFGV
jgi:hypothetical protein